MAEACALAANGEFTSGGNPRVGCVILNSDGQVVGRGHHRGAGYPHAETIALDAAREAARGGTAVVTLEPCRHIGRTPPCTDALIAAGVARVVYAVADPGAQSSGGAAVLRDAGIDVVGGVGIEQALPLVHDWLHVQRTGRPWVIAKCAMSLDGRVAGPGGRPYALTSTAMNAENHKLRAASDAIIVGSGTIRSDDPQLTVRDDPPATRQPLRIVIGRTDVPADARVRGEGFRHFPTHDVRAVLAELATMGCQRVLVEGGPTLHRAMIDADCVDEVRWTISPVLLGDGPLAGFGGGASRAVALTDVRIVGEDVLLTGQI